MNKNKIIMLCAPARSGKDTITKNILKQLSENTNAGNWVRYGFADTLRRDCQYEVFERFNVDVWDDNKKHLFRQYLLDFGKKRRLETNGMYLIDPFIKLFKENDLNFIITDYRYLLEYETISKILEKTADIYPIYIQRYVMVDGMKFTLEPTIPQEVDEYHKIIQSARTIQVPWVDKEDIDTICPNIII